MFVIMPADKIPKIVVLLTDAYLKRSKGLDFAFFKVYVGVYSALTFSKSYSVKMSFNPKFI